MKRQPQRTPFTLLLSADERKIIETNSKAFGLSANAYIRFLIFQSQQDEISTDRSPLANAAIPEINVKTYSALCDIANSLKDILKSARDRSNIISVDRVERRAEQSSVRTLLEETLALVKKTGLQLASNKN